MRKPNLWVVFGAGLCALGFAGLCVPQAQFEFFLQSGIRISTPLILAALGELIAEKSGVINIGLEGFVLVGAFSAFAVTVATGSLFLGVIAAMGGSVLLAVLFGGLCVTFSNDQIVGGAAINFLALGATGLLYATLYGATGAAITVVPLSDRNFPGLERIPYLGPAIFSQTALTYLAFVLSFAVFLVFRKTGIGFHLEAVGENPRAAAAAGISVLRWRWSAVLAEGALGGLAGACLSLSNSNTFNEGMSNGRGFIALAIVIFGRWSPLGIVGAALFFGSAEALQLLLQGSDIPFLREHYPYLQTLPYLVTLIALAAASGKTRAPSGLGRHYRRE